MARDRKVTVTVEGDTSDIVKKLDKLEKSVADTSAEIEDIGKKTVNSSKDIGKGFDGIRDSADNSERRIVGFRDSLTGTSDVMGGLRSGNMVQLATGFADLASSVANLGADMLEWGKKAWTAAKDVVAAHGASVIAKGKDIAASVAQKVATAATTVATYAQTAAQWALNVAMEANPIALVIVGLVALGAAFVLLWQHSETFRDIVTGAFDAVKAAAEFVWNWISDNWPLLLAILTGPIGLAVYEIAKHWDAIKSGLSEVKDWITTHASGMWDGIKDAFKGVINFIITSWNKLQFKLPSFAGLKVAGQTVIPGWEGPTLGVPQIKPLHTGGVFRAPTPGGTGFALLRDGERVSTPGSAGGPSVVFTGPVYGNPADFGRYVQSALKAFQRTGG